MSWPLAVVIIVGSTITGPIQSNPLPPSPEGRARYGSCMERWKDVPLGSDMRMRSCDREAYGSENIAQACERALKVLKIDPKFARCEQAPDMPARILGEHP